MPADDELAVGADVSVDLHGVEVAGDNATATDTSVKKYWYQEVRINVALSLRVLDLLAHQEKRSGR